MAADLVRADPLKNAFSFLETLDFDKEVWGSRLALYAYDILFGPRLARDEARLQGASAGVLHLWEAVQSFCGWLVDLAWAVRNSEGRKKALSWNDLRGSLQGEVPLESEFFAPGWSESVLLTGIADSLLRLPRSGKWCVQEYKLGRTSPEADLGQVCLYHLILAQKSGSRKSARRGDFKSMLALITFQPEMKERLFSEDEIIPAKGIFFSRMWEIRCVCRLSTWEHSGVPPTVQPVKRAARPCYPRDNRGPEKDETAGLRDRPEGQDRKRNSSAS